MVGGVIPSLNVRNKGERGRVGGKKQRGGSKVTAHIGVRACAVSGACACAYTRERKRQKIRRGAPNR
jgi:hypothetical protein